MWAGLLPLYEELQSRGVEMIYDDRQVSAGIMFSDAGSSAASHCQPEESETEYFGGGFQG